MKESRRTRAPASPSPWPICLPEQKRHNVRASDDGVSLAQTPFARENNETTRGASLANHCGAGARRASELPAGFKLLKRRRR